MAQQRPTRAEVIAWELAEYGIVVSGGHLWQGYAVGSRDEVYAELGRLELRSGTANPEAPVPHDRH